MWAIVAHSEASVYGMPNRVIGRGGDGPEFSPAVAVDGNASLIFISGQVGLDDGGHLVGDDLAGQAAQVFRNLGRLLDEAGAGFEDVVSFTTYLTSQAHVSDFIAFRTGAFPALFPGRQFPTNTLLVVSGLARPEFVIEVSAIAVREAAGARQ
jgi:enamine deaminase RidA (YjgF/YER057c/UK114 family)